MIILALGSRRGRNWAALLLALLIAGCAGETAYRDGLKLMDQGQYEQGLAKLEEATTANPGDNRYRMALLSNRGTAVERLLNMGAAAEAQDRPKDAEAIYRRALSVDPNNSRAKEALRTLERLDTQNDVVRQAQSALARKDLDYASTVV